MPANHLIACMARSYTSVAFRVGMLANLNLWRYLNASP